MRFLRVSLVALLALTLVGSAALADTAPDTSTATAESSSESSTAPGADSSTEPAEPDPSEPAPTESTDAGSDVEDEVYEEPNVTDLVYGELKGVVSAITPAEGDSPATVTVMVEGQAITFRAEQLGLTPEALALITVGAEFKYEYHEGKLELKITSETGTVKVERKEDGSLELKVEVGHPGKGKEISEENKSRAEEHKEAARQKAEEAKQNGKGHGHGKDRR